MDSGAVSRRREGVIATREATPSSAKVDAGPSRTHTARIPCAKCKGTGNAKATSHHPPGHDCVMCNQACAACKGARYFTREVDRAARKARGVEVADEDRRW